MRFQWEARSCATQNLFSYGEIVLIYAGMEFHATVWGAAEIVYGLILTTQDVENEIRLNFPKCKLFHNQLFAAGVQKSLQDDSTVWCLVGTPFQLAVWKELVTMVDCASYEELARRAGCPKAVRAVGSAVGKNPISLFVPCHRVVPKGGGVGNYRFGSSCKLKLLSAERLILT